MPESLLRAPTAPDGLRERNKRDKLSRIVAAADELFREQGFEATTGRQICARAGIGTGTLFLYVRDKRELLFLIFRPLAEDAFARLAPGLAARESIVDGAMRLFGAFFGIYAGDPALARLFVQELFFRADPGEGMRALNQELRRRLDELVVSARTRGELRDDVDAARLGLSLAAHYVFWIQLWLGTGEVDRAAAEQGLRESLVLQLEGLRGMPDGEEKEQGP